VFPDDHSSFIQTAVAIAIGVYGVLSGFHALLTKRDPRSTVGWMMLCVFLPAIGASLYWLLGVNRIQTRARRWQAGGRFDLDDALPVWDASAELAHHHPAEAEMMRALLNTSSRVTGKPLVRGNRVVPLFNGEQAYPAMLEAIDAAERTIFLSTYIFDVDETGSLFVDALAAAVDRGVEVKVLIDAFGERYSRPRASKVLRKRGVRAARFLPLTLSPRALRVNLRNHRKLLIVDGKVAFTGGMNLGRRHMVEVQDNPKRTRDVHFEIEGPAAWALEQVFWEDWHFTTDEDPDWVGRELPAEAGPALCRGIADGPNEDLDKLQWIYVGALACAHRRVQIMTPYFVPTRELTAAINAASLRGVEVEIVIPEKANLGYVSWACQAMLPEVLKYGSRVFYQPAPFNHSKLMVVDDIYVLLGSANLDPRSLRLNFEFNLEVYEPKLAHELSQHIDRVRSTAREVSLEELEARSFWIRLRDSIGKLMSPYL
jgi:cardiolipin synthase